MWRISLSQMWPLVLLISPSLACLGGGGGGGCCASGASSCATPCAGSGIGGGYGGFAGGASYPSGGYSGGFSDVGGLPAGGGGYASGPVGGSGFSYGSGGGGAYVAPAVEGVQPGIAGPSAIGPLVGGGAGGYQAAPSIGAIGPVSGPEFGPQQVPAAVGQQGGGSYQSQGIVPGSGPVGGQGIGPSQVAPAAEFVGGQAVGNQGMVASQGGIAAPVPSSGGPSSSQYIPSTPVGGSNVPSSNTGSQTPDDGEYEEVIEYVDENEGTGATGGSSQTSGSNSNSLPSSGSSSNGDARDTEIGLGTVGTQAGEYGQTPGGNSNAGNDGALDGSTYGGEPSAPLQPPAPAPTSYGNAPANTGSVAPTNYGPSLVPTYSAPSNPPPPSNEYKKRDSEQQYAAESNDLNTNYGSSTAASTSDGNSAGSSNGGSTNYGAQPANTQTAPEVSSSSNAQRASNSNSQTNSEAATAEEKSPAPSSGNYGGTESNTGPSGSNTGSTETSQPAAPANNYQAPNSVNTPDTFVPALPDTPKNSQKGDDYADETDTNGSQQATNANSNGGGQPQPAPEPTAVPPPVGALVYQPSAPVSPTSEAKEPSDSYEVLEHTIAVPTGEIVSGGDDNESSSPDSSSNSAPSSSQSQTSDQEKPQVGSVSETPSAGHEVVGVQPAQVFGVSPPTLIPYNSEEEKLQVTVPVPAEASEGGSVETPESPSNPVPSSEVTSTPAPPPPPSAVEQVTVPPLEPYKNEEGEEIITAHEQEIIQTENRGQNEHQTTVLDTQDKPYEEPSPTYKMNKQRARARGSKTRFFRRPAVSAPQQKEDLEPLFFIIRRK